VFETDSWLGFDAGEAGVERFGWLWQKRVYASHSADESADQQQEPRGV